MTNTPESFIIQISIASAVFSILLTLAVSWIFLLKIGYGLLVWLFFTGVLFYTLYNLPVLNAKSLEKKIEQDIFMTGRRLLTLLESGEALISALIDVSKAKTHSAKYFGEIAYDIYLGKTLEDAIDKGISLSPSISFKRILQQINNSLQTGSSIFDHLTKTLNDIYKNKIVQIEEYGKKLNPLCMFYMIFGTIIPSIGLVMILLFLSFMQINVSFILLMVILLFVFLIQLFFITLFSKMRPVVGY